MENRIGPYITKCICPPDEKGISRLNIGTAKCTTCSFGVIEATFFKDLSKISFDVGGKINLIDLTLANTATLCEALFESDFIEKVGGMKGVICDVIDGALIVYLGAFSSI